MGASKEGGVVPLPIHSVVNQLFQLAGLLAYYICMALERRMVYLIMFGAMLPWVSQKLMNIPIRFGVRQSRAAEIRGEEWRGERVEARGKGERIVEMRREIEAGTREAMQGPTSER